MDWSQIIYATLLLVASLTGRPSMPLLFAMWADFTATMIFASDPMMVATADILAACILIMRSRREAAIAAIFMIMLPIYVLGDAQGFSGAAIYAIVDVIALFQLALMGKWDRGIRRHVYNGIRRRNGGGSSAGAWAVVERVCRVAETDEVSDGR